MDLFEYAREKNMKDEAPLASRLRPAALDEVVGQMTVLLSFCRESPFVRRIHQLASNMQCSLLYLAVLKILGILC